MVLGEETFCAKCSRFRGSEEYGIGPERPAAPAVGAVSRRAYPKQFTARMAPLSTISSAPVIRLRVFGCALFARTEAS